MAIDPAWTQRHRWVQSAACAAPFPAAPLVLVYTGGRVSDPVHYVLRGS